MKSLIDRVRLGVKEKSHPRLGALVRNASIVFSGNVLSSVIGLLYLAVLTRALTIEQFGLYSLYGALVTVVGRFASFQTWQAQIHYGAHAREAGDGSLICSILFFGWLLDVVAGLIGFLVALLLASMLPQLFGLPQDSMVEVAVAASILIFNWICSPTAFFRLYDRFFPQALYQNVSNTLQLVCVVFLWLTGEKRLLAYLAVTSINNIIGQLWFFIYAFREARKQGLFVGERANLTQLKEGCPGIVKFVLITNLDGMIRVLRDVDIFLVNALAGMQATGLYKIAKTLNAAFGKLTGPFYQSIYPELARMVSARNTASMVSLMKQASLMLGTITFLAWVGFILLGPYFLPLAFGAEYSDAYSVAAWSMAAMVVWGIAQPLSPVMMALRKPGVSMMVHLVATLAYVALLTLLVWKLGLVGAGVALLLFYLLWSCAMFMVVAQELKTDSGKTKVV